MKWFFGVLLVLICVATGFFGARLIYKCPENPVPVIIDTLYVNTPVSIDVDSIKDYAFHQGYMEGLSNPIFLHDTLTKEVDSLAIYQELLQKYTWIHTTKLTFEPKYFNVWITLYSTREINSFLLTKPPNYYHLIDFWLFKSVIFFYWNV